MSSEPDVFKKLEALLNKHRQTDAAAAPDDAIPTLLEVVDAPVSAPDAPVPEIADDTLPVLTDMISEEDTTDTVTKELELDLEFIPDDDLGPMPEPLMAADLPDLWERNEHEFDAETTHGFGLSAFSREAAAEARNHEWSAPERDAVSAPPTQPTVDDVIIDASAPPSDFAAAAAQQPFTHEPNPEAPRTTENNAPPPADGMFDSSDDFSADDGGDSAPEVAISDALAERALRDLDRHIAQVLENQVGPQLAQRLDAALASMLEQFSTNLESLIREAVRDEMRRYFDGNGQ